MSEPDQHSAIPAAPPRPDEPVPETMQSAQTSARPVGPLRKILPDSRPLALPAFRRMFVSRIGTVIGAQLTAVAVQQQIFDLTHSSAWVGIASVVALVPLIVFGLLGGAIADTYDRRKLLLITESGIAVTSIGLWLTALSGHTSLWVIMALLALQQAFFAVNQPTMSAITPRVVPRELIISAQALNMAVFSVGVIIGPLLVGLLLPLIGLPWLYFLDAVSLVALLPAVIMLPAMPRADTHAGRAKVIDGLRYLKSRPLLLMTFVADLIAMICGMPRALFPQMAEQTFGDPPGGGPVLGLLNASFAVGVLVGSLSTGWVHRVHRQGLAIVAAIVVFGLAMAGFGISPGLWVALGFLAIGGWADLVSSIYRSTLLQVASTDKMRGRTQGVFTVVVAGGPRLADLVHGLVAAATSTKFAVVGGGLLCVVLVLVAAWWGRSLRAYDSRRAELGPAEVAPA